MKKIHKIQLPSLLLLGLLGTAQAQIVKVEMKIDGYLCGRWAYNVSKAVSRLEIGVKPDAVKFPEINRGLAYFNPPPGRAVDIGRLAELLRESGYKLRLVRLTLDGEVGDDGSQVRIPGSGQVFALAGLPAAVRGRVRIVAGWNADQAAAQKTVHARKEVLDVESARLLP